MIGTPAPDQAPGGNQNGRGRNGQRRQRPPSGAVDANGTYLATLASRNHVDRASLERAIVTWLRDANQRRLDQLRPGDAQAATPETRARFSSRAQWQTLVDENARADLPLEQRVRIYQRLQGIQTNAELIQQATDAREEALNSLHSDPNLEYCQAAFHALNRLQSRFGPVRDVLPAISGLPTHRRSSSRSERIAELRQQMQEIEPSQAAGPAGFTLLQYFEAAQTDANLRNGARLAEAQRLYGELSRRAREVAGLARLVASRRDEMTQELASPLTQFAAIAQGLSSAVSDAVRHLPYITTHLGSTDSDVSASTTGALSDVLRGHVAEIVASLPRENARAPASGAE